MQFRDLKRQYETLKNEIDKGISEVISNSCFISGAKVKELEEKLAEYTGVKHCVTCANGTDALSLALMVWQIKEGQAVFVPDFTFFASAEVVSYCGATPVFVDVDPETYNINPTDLEKKIKMILSDGQLEPAAVIVVDLFGQPADYEAVKKIAEKYNLKILEDSAQGFGGQIGNRMAGSFGDISTTSFFPAKPLGCYGDGGAIFTDNDEWAKLLRSFCVHGKGSEKYDNVRIGVNSRLDTIQAAILLPKLKAFIEYEKEAVNKVARIYDEGLKGLVKLPYVKENYVSSWAQYTIQLSDKREREALQKHLKNEGIPSMVYYPRPMHKQKAFMEMKYAKENYPVAEKLCDTVLSLPMHPYLEESEQNAVVQSIREFFDKE